MHFLFVRANVCPQKRRRFFSEKDIIGCPKSQFQKDQEMHIRQEVELVGSSSPILVSATGPIEDEEGEIESNLRHFEGPLPQSHDATMINTSSTTGMGGGNPRQLAGDNKETVTKSENMGIVMAMAGDGNMTSTPGNSGSGQPVTLRVLSTSMLGMEEEEEAEDEELYERIQTATAGDNTIGKE